jgi:hypothetical protein
MTTRTSFHRWRLTEPLISWPRQLTDFREPRRGGQLGIMLKTSFLYRLRKTRPGWLAGGRPGEYTCLPRPGCRDRQPVLRGGSLERTLRGGRIAATECFGSGAPSMPRIRPRPERLHHGLSVLPRVRRTTGLELAALPPRPEQRQPDPHCATYHLINDPIRAGIREYIRELSRAARRPTPMYKNLEVRPTVR